MTEKLTFYLDRSGAELDDRCGQAFYWNRMANGKGIVPNLDALALRVGGEIHEDAAVVAEMPDLRPEDCERYTKAIFDKLPFDCPQAEREVAYRRAGWFTALVLYNEPKLRGIYDTIHTESELILDRDPLWMAVTPDRVLKHRVGGYHVYRELKSTISSSSKWLRSWHRRAQLHTSMAALKEEGINVEFAQIMGLMKGDYREGQLRHPYVYAYYNTQTHEWTPEYRRGGNWILAPIWEYPGGIVEWVQRCGEDVALAQFPHTEPIFLDMGLVEDFVKRRTHRAQTIAAWQGRGSPADDMVWLFERRTQNCIPAFGDPCPYNPICWNPSWQHNPQDHPDFKPRDPHHLVELVGVSEYES
jgi:hypothetical protein